MGVGRRPKPTALKLIQGNPGHRPINKDEPKPKIPQRAMKAPPHLSEGARREWKRIAPELHRLGLLTLMDKAALEAYCVCYDRWRQAEAKVKERGDILRTENGNIIHNPYLSVANRARDDLKKFIVEFGMTPSSRTNIVSPVKEKGSFDDV